MYSYSYASAYEYETVKTSYSGGYGYSEYERHISGTNYAYGNMFTGFYDARTDANGYFADYDYSSREFGRQYAIAYNPYSQVYSLQESYDTGGFYVRYEIDTNGAYGYASNYSRYTTTGYYYENSYSVYDAYTPAYGYLSYNNYMTIPYYVN